MPVLKIEPRTVYVTPLKRRCVWQPGRRSDMPNKALTFRYLGARGGVEDGFTMLPTTALRLLQQEGP